MSRSRLQVDHVNTTGMVEHVLHGGALHGLTWSRYSQKSGCYVTIYTSTSTYSPRHDPGAAQAAQVRDLIGALTAYCSSILVQFCGYVPQCKCCMST